MFRRVLGGPSEPAPSINSGVMEEVNVHADNLSIIEPTSRMSLLTDEKINAEIQRTNSIILNHKKLYKKIQELNFTISEIPVQVKAIELYIDNILSVKNPLIDMDVLAKIRAHLNRAIDLMKFQADLLSSDRNHS